MTLARVVTISVLFLAGSILAAACSFDVSAYGAALAALDVSSPLPSTLFSERLATWIGHAELARLIKALFTALPLDEISLNLALSWRLFSARLSAFETLWCFYALAFIAVFADGALARCEAIDRYEAYSPNRYSIAVRLAIFLLAAFLTTLALPVGLSVPLAQGLLMLGICCARSGVRNFHRFER